MLFIRIRNIVTLTLPDFLLKASKHPPKKIINYHYYCY